MPKVSNEKVTRQNNDGESETAAGTIYIAFEDYFNDYNVQYAKLIPAAIKTAVECSEKSHYLSDHDIVSRTDRIIRALLEKRDDAIVDKVSNFNLIWDEGMPDV